MSERLIAVVGVSHRTPSKFRIPGISGVNTRQDNMDPEVYLKQHHIMTYIEDAVKFLLERKDEDSKTKPMDVLADYFKSVRDGTHILFREYTFVSATPHNRTSFIKAFQQNYAKVAAQGGLMKTAEYLSLLRLLCSDFPQEMVEKVATVIFSHSALESLVSFPNFLYTFQVVFYYEHFLSQCEKLWSPSPAHHHLPGAAVVVPVPSAAGEADYGTSRPTSAASHDPKVNRRDSEPEGSRAVETAVISKAMMSMIQRQLDREPWFLSPSVGAVEEVLNSFRGARLTFYDFVLSLSRSERVNLDIGALPPIKS